MGRNVHGPKWSWAERTRDHNSAVTVIDNLQELSNFNDLHICEFCNRNCFSERL